MPAVNWHFLLTAISCVCVLICTYLDVPCSILYVCTLFTFLFYSDYIYIYIRCHIYYCTNLYLNVA